MKPRGDLGVRRFMLSESLEREEPRWVSRTAV